MPVKKHNTAYYERVEEEKKIIYHLSIRQGNVKWKFHYTVWTLVIIVSKLQALTVKGRQVKHF